MSTEPVTDFEYADSGTGPALLLLPGSFGTGAGWKAVIGHLGAGWRAITTSLLGYGATPDVRPEGNASMAQEVELIDRLIERIGTPPHVVAHSFGALSALAHAVHGQHRAASLVLVEANPLGLLRATGNHQHYEMFMSMTARYFADVAQGQPEAARRVIDFYGGPGAFDAMPPKVRAYIVATTPVNVRDWHAGTSFEPSVQALQGINIPTTLIYGSNSHPAMLRIAELLHASMTGARLVMVEGGSHFLPATHAAEIAGVICQLKRLR